MSTSELVATIELVAYFLIATVVVTWLDAEYHVWRRAVRRRMHRHAKELL